jgi:hypothetical protein
MNKDEVINYKEIFYLDLDEDKKLITEEDNQHKDDQEDRINLINPIVGQSSPFRNDDHNSMKSKLKLLKSKHNREKLNFEEKEAKLDHKEELLGTKQKLLHNPKFKDLLKMVEPEIVKNSHLEVLSMSDCKNEGRSRKDFSEYKDSRENFFRSLSPTQTKIQFLCDEIKSLQGSVQNTQTPDNHKKTTINILNNINFFDAKCNFKEIYDKEKLKLVKNSMGKSDKNIYKKENDKKEIYMKTVTSRFLEKEKNKPKYPKIMSPRHHGESPMKNLLSPMMRDEFKRDYMENKRLEILSLMSVANSNSLRDSKNTQFNGDCSTTSKILFPGRKVESKFEEEIERGLLSGRTTSRTTGRSTCRSTARKNIISPSIKEENVGISNFKKAYDNLESPIYMDRLNNLNKRLFNQCINYFEDDNDFKNLDKEIKSSINIMKKPITRDPPVEKKQVKQSRIISEKNTYSVPKFTLYRSNRKIMY